jgi:hypothetical protein
MTIYPTLDWRLDMSAQPKVIERPIDWDELYPGRFIKPSDLKGKKVSLIISRVRVEELVGEKGPQMKGIINFEGKEKALPLNKTNGLCLKAMFGSKVQQWVGHKVTLFESVWDGDACIRVWGSPELTEDRQVTIALPRKRPFDMTMHAVSVGPKPVQSTQPSPDAEQDNTDDPQS